MTESDEDYSSGEEDEKGLEDADVVTKYKEAAKITNSAMQKVIEACVEGSRVVDICMLGDQEITDQTAKIYRSKKDSEGKDLSKGVAYPTCLNVNNCVCGNSPLKSDETTLKNGDIVKIDLGTHIDGYIATGANTIVVGSTPEKPLTGKAADVIAAAHTGIEVILRMVRPEMKNNAIPDVLEKVAEAYGVNVVEGVMSHQMKRFVIDCNKTILAKQTVDQRVDECTFEEGEVYHLDVAMSTGEGKPKNLDEKNTFIYKRAVDQNYYLRVKASRFLLNEIDTRFPSLPFSLRNLEDKRARLGMPEIVSHELVHSYPVLHEKEGEIVAHFKFTVLLMPSGSMKIIDNFLPAVESDKKVEDKEILALLATSVTKKKKKNKKKKKKAQSDETPTVEE